MIICIECNGEVDIDTKVQLMSNPPQYKGICSCCKRVVYVVCREYDDVQRRCVKVKL